MANGKAIQALKDKVDKEGCFYGQTTRDHHDLLKNDVNSIGKKIGRMNWLVITTLAALVVNLIVLYFKK